MSPSVAPTGTVSPSAAVISASVPETGDGTSMSTLSVVTSTTVSPSATASPAFLTQLTTVPSVTDSPIAGRVSGTVSGTGEINS
jgi:hypothetical protein